MVFFVDANVIVYAATSGPYREPCIEILSGVAGGRAAGRTSTAVLEEVWRVELSGKAGDIAGLAESAFTLFAPLLPVDHETVGRALALSAPALGANDRIHVATCALNDIGTIVTADADFGDVRGIRRIDPLDERALRRLLAT